jgi:hypothetical protein
MRDVAVHVRHLGQAFHNCDGEAASFDQCPVKFNNNEMKDVTQVVMGNEVQQLCKATASFAEKTVRTRKQNSDNPMFSVFSRITRNR